MKKVAIITSHVIQYQLPFFNELSKIKDIEFFFFSASDHGFKKRSFDGELKSNTQWVKEINIKNFYINKSKCKINSFFLYYPNLISILKKKKIDQILILGWNKLIFWQAIIFSILNYCKIYLRAENNLEHSQSIIKKFIKLIFFRLFFKIFDKIFYIGYLNKQFYLKYGLKKKKLIFCPYSVNNFFFQNKKKVIKKNKLSFIFVGKFIPRKNISLIIDVANKLKTHGKLIFNLIGNGPLFSDIKKLKKKLRLKNVKLHGYKNQYQISKLYKKNDILILPSAYETWGLVVNEAMAAGLPCIVSNKVGCRYDLVKNGKTGFIFRYNSSNDLCNKILYFKKNYFKLIIFKKEIKEQINKYSINKSISNLIDEFKKI